MMKRLLRASVLVIVFGGIQLVRADTFSRGTSYTQNTPDRRSVFVMLALDPENDKAIRDKELRNRALSVRRKYKVSGLYLKNDATRPLWTIDWYSSAIRLSFTGEYLIADSRFLRFDESGEVDPQAEVLKFFRNGSLLSSLTARELVRDFEALPNSMSMKMWACRASFDLARNQYSVHTFEKQKLVFDATNGKMISSQKLKSIQCNPLLGPIN